MRPTAKGIQNTVKGLTIYPLSLLTPVGQGSGCEVTQQCGIMELLRDRVEGPKAH